MDAESLEELLSTEHLNDWFRNMQVEHKSELIEFQRHASIEKELLDWYDLVKDIETQATDRLQVNLTYRRIQPLATPDETEDPETFELAIAKLRHPSHPLSSVINDVSLAFHFLSRNFTFRDFKRSNGRLLPLDNRFASQIYRRFCEDSPRPGTVRRALADFSWASDLVLRLHSAIDENCDPLTKYERFIAIFKDLHSQYARTFNEALEPDNSCYYIGALLGSRPSHSYISALLFIHNYVLSLDLFKNDMNSQCLERFWYWAELIVGSTNIEQMKVFWRRREMVICVDLVLGQDPRKARVIEALRTLIGTTEKIVNGQEFRIAIGDSEKSYLVDTIVMDRMLRQSRVVLMYVFNEQLSWVEAWVRKSEKVIVVSDKQLTGSFQFVMDNGKSDLANILQETLYSAFMELPLRPQSPTEHRRAMTT
jgi:hypothetical protein